MQPEPSRTAPTAADGPAIGAESDRPTFLHGEIIPSNGHLAAPPPSAGSILALVAVKPLLLAAIASSSVLLAACIIDLSDLTGGAPDAGSGGSGAATAASTSTGSPAAAGSGGSSAPGMLDCAPCPAGGCAATTLASGQDAAGPAGIAVTSDGLYWVNRTGNAVMRLASTGGAPQVLATATAPVALAVAGGHVIWAAQGGVYGCATSSCKATTLEVSTSTMSGSIQGVAYDAQYVYFTDEGSGASTGKAVRCPFVSMCHGGKILGSMLDKPVGIALFGTTAFFTEQSDGNLNGDVDQSPTAGGGATRVASTLQLPTAVAADGMNVYWTESDPSSGKVRRCPYAAGYCMTPEDLATGLAAPLDVGLAGGRVYWSNAGDGRVLSCPATGCGGGAPRVHASGRTGLRRIALGASCVFFTDDQDGGSVSKAAL